MHTISRFSLRNGNILSEKLGYSKFSKSPLKWVFSQSQKSCQPPHPNPKNPEFYSPENHQHTKQTPLPFVPPAPPAHVPQPAHSDGDKGLPLSKLTALLLEVGSCQRRGQRPNPSVESHWKGPRSVTPRDHRGCFPPLSNQLQAWSSSWSVMQHGSDYWDWSNIVTCPQGGHAQPGKRVLLAGS